MPQLRDRHTVRVDPAVGIGGPRISRRVVAENVVESRAIDRRADQRREFQLRFQQQCHDGLTVEQDVEVDVPGVGTFTAPIQITNAEGSKSLVVATGPLEIDFPADSTVQAIQEQAGQWKIIPINDSLFVETLPMRPQRVLVMLKA